MASYKTGKINATELTHTHTQAHTQAHTHTHTYTHIHTSETQHDKQQKFRFITDIST